VLDGGNYSGTMTTPRSEAPPPDGSWRARLHQIIFEADTFAGRVFDVGLIALILISIVAVSIESLQGLSPGMQRAMVVLEWVLTGLFTLEYVLRLVAVKRPLAYATSFFGVVDLLAIMPTWLGLFIPGAQALLVVRVLRLLRIFRILKLARFLSEAQTLTRALRASMRKITVFLLSVGTIVVIVGSLMFVVEGPQNGFTSIPVGMYWAVVTLTTVGYGDIAPRTALGQALASLVMILGYGIIAVPTGIVTSELALGSFHHGVSTQACPTCSAGAHDVDAKYCRVCGGVL
jgi:voltage-gated potassium channel